MISSLNTPSRKMQNIASTVCVWAQKIDVKASCYMTESGSSFAGYKEPPNRVILALLKAIQEHWQEDYDIWTLGREISTFQLALWIRESQEFLSFRMQHKLPSSSHTDHQVSKEPTNARGQPVVKTWDLSLCASTSPLGKNLIEL